MPATAHKSVLLAGLKACSNSRDLRKGRILHSRAIDLGHHSDVFVATSLINMYTKCDSMSDARTVFDSTLHKDTILWNSLILGYATTANEELALKLLTTMRLEGFAPNAGTFIAALKACSNLAAREEWKTHSDDEERLKIRALGRGRKVHSQAAAMDLDSDAFVTSSLVDMYAKCGSLVGARRVFERMAKRDTVTFTALMLGYADNGHGEAALELFSSMEQSGCAPNARTFVAALKACASLARNQDRDEGGGSGKKMAALETGMRIHSQAAKRSFVSDIFVGNGLVGMYLKCGSVLDARRVFDSMRAHSAVSWNVLILGYVENEQAEVALELALGFLREQREIEETSLVAAIKACVAAAAREASTEVDGVELKLAALERGMELELHSRSRGKSLLVASALVEMYSKCGAAADARRAFAAIEFADAIAATALMLALCESGAAELVLELFSRLRAAALPIDGPILAAALKASGGAAAIEATRATHADLCRLGLASASDLVAPLVDAYGKCGSLAAAERIFDAAASRARGVVAWTALIAAFGRQGESRRALELFDAMVAEGVDPNAVTIQSALAACSHGGMVARGERLFARVREGRFAGVALSLEHYVCMADILGRAHKVEAAVKMVAEMPFRPNVVAWRTILSLCRRWDRYELAKEAFESLVALEGRNAAGYKLLVDSVFNS